MFLNHLNPEFFGAWILWTQHFSNSKFVWSQNLFDPHCFVDPWFFWSYFFEPIILFMDQHFFWTNIFSWSKIPLVSFFFRLFHQELFQTQIVLHLDFVNPKSLRLRIVCSQNVSRPKFILDPKFSFDPQFFGPNIFVCPQLDFKLGFKSGTFELAIGSSTWISEYVTPKCCCF